MGTKMHSRNRYHHQNVLPEEDVLEDALNTTLISPRSKLATAAKPFFESFIGADVVRVPLGVRDFYVF